MNTNLTPLQSIHWLIDAMKAMEPYQNLPRDEWPTELAYDLAEAIMAAPSADFMDSHKEIFGPWQDWAQDILERRDYPEFFALLADMGRIRDEQGEEALHEAEHADLFIQLMRNAPPRYRGEAETILSDALPTATHVDEDGQPVYSAQQIAQKFGMPTQKLEADIQRLQGKGLLEGALYSGPVHPVH